MPAGGGPRFCFLRRLSFFQQRGRANPFRPGGEMFTGTSSARPGAGGRRGGELHRALRFAGVCGHPNQLPRRAVCAAAVEAASGKSPPGPHRQNSNLADGDELRSLAAAALLHAGGFVVAPGKGVRISRRLFALLGPLPECVFRCFALVAGFCGRTAGFSGKPVFAAWRAGVARVHAANGVLLDPK